MNTIVIELCKEDRARLDAILEALKSAAPRCDNCLKLVGELINGEKPAQGSPDPAQDETPKQTPPKTEKPAETKTEAPEVKAEASEVKEDPADPTDDEELPIVTQADIQKKVIALASAGKKAEVKEIVNQYAEKVSAIPADKLPEVYAKLTALEG